MSANRCSLLYVSVSVSMLCVLVSHLAISTSAAAMQQRVIKYRNRNGVWVDKRHGALAPSARASNHAPSSLPADVFPATSLADWKVNPASRNLRLACTPFHYDAAFGPDVDVTLVYVRERSIKTIVGRQWSCNYDSYFAWDGNNALRVLRPNGVTLRYEWQSSGQIIYPNRSDDRLYFTTSNLYIIRPDNSYEEYSLQHRALSALADDRGLRLEFLRDVDGTLQGIVDAAGATSAVVIASGLLQQIVDPLGRVATFTYNGEWLDQVISVAGETNSFEYDTANFAVSHIATPALDLSISAGYSPFSTNAFGIREWWQLTLLNDVNDYQCSYSWTSSSVAPSYYEARQLTTCVRPGSGGYWTNAITLRCQRTDSDARNGDRVAKYYLQGLTVLAEDEMIGATANPVRREYFSADGFPLYTVEPRAANCHVITRHSYNAAGQVTETAQGVWNSSSLAAVLSGATTSWITRVLYQCDYADNGALIRQQTPRATDFYYYTNLVIDTVWGACATVQLCRAHVSQSGAATIYDYDARGRLVRTTRCARPAVFTQSPAGDLYLVSTSIYAVAVYLDASQDRVTSYAYGADGYLAAQTNAIGAVTHFSHDAGGRVDFEQLSGVGGYAVTRSYDDADRITAALDSRAGLSLANSYNRFGLTNSVNAAGERTSFALDTAAGRVTAVSTPYGRVAAFGYPKHSVPLPLSSADTFGDTVYTYANNACPLATIAPDGSVYARAYDLHNRLVAITNQFDGITDVLPDTWNRATATVDRVTGLYAESSYDTADRFVAGADSAGAWRSNVYAHDNLVAVHTPDGVASLEYDNFNQIVKFTTPAGFWVSNVYDKTGFLTSSIDALGRVVSRARHGVSDLPASATDARGACTTFSYDAARNLTNVAPALGAHTAMRHDAMGRVTSVVCGVSDLQMSYDGMGRISARRAGSGAGARAATEYEYVAAQPKPALIRTFYENSIDRSGVPRSLSNSYDACGRLACVTDPAGNSVSLTYNGLGQITAIAAPAGRSASFQYDAAGRLTQESDFHGRVSSLSHNANERTTVVTRPDNTSMTTVRDIMGRLASITSAGGNSRATTFAWRNDGVLRAASCTLAGDTVSDAYALNLAGEILGRTSSYSMAAAGPFIINYGCDAGGLVTNITSPLSGFSYREIDRDALGRVTALNAAACAVTCTYDANSRLVHAAKGDHAMDSISYDPLGRITARTISSDRDEATFVPRLFVTNSFDHCAPARLLAQTMTCYGKTTTSVSRVYTYDLLDQVCGEEMIANGTQAWYNAYAYNGFGDIITCRNEVVTYTGNSTITRGTGGNAVNYRFDARGNCTNVGAAATPRFFDYDADNNVIGAAVGPTNWTFRHNAQNQMVYSKLSVKGDTADERCYLYDGLDCIAELKPDGTLLRQFIRNGNIAGVVAEIIHNDETVAHEFRNATFYYHYNHRGDVIAVSAADGTLVWQCDYDAFGLPLSIDPGPFTPRFSFSTKRYFAEFGAYYYGYRWYLPELCRWMQKDPLSAELLNNDFAFNCNNPVFYVDEDGRVPCPITDISQLPFSDKIRKESFDKATPQSRLAAYNTLSQIQKEGGTPNGEIEIKGERVKITAGVKWNCDIPSRDSALSSGLKGLLEGSNFKSSSHFPGSPSLNETEYRDGTFQYDTDLTNPNEGIPVGLITGPPISDPQITTGLIGHVADASLQIAGHSLSADVYNGYSSGISPPAPPPGGGATPSTAATPNPQAQQDPPPPGGNQPPSTKPEPPPGGGNGSCNETKKP